MPRNRVHSAAIAAASDGSILINMAEVLPAPLLARLELELGAPAFVGLPLGQRDAGGVIARLDGAAAEAAAHLIAARPQKRRKSTEARAKRRR